MGRLKISILAIILANFFFTINDALFKYFSDFYPLHEIVFFRALSGIGFVFLLFLWREGGINALKVKRPGLHIFRMSMVIIANMAFFVSLVTVPLAEATALFFLAPVFIALFAIPVLREKLTRRRSIAIFLGLIGTVLIVRPGFESFRWSYLLPLLSALAYTGLQLATRSLRAKAKPGVLTFYTQTGFLIISVATGLVFGKGWLSENIGNPSLYFLFRAWSWPFWPHLLLLVFVGFVHTLATYYSSQAYRLSQAGLVAPIEYVAIIFAVLWGGFFWGEWPGWFSYLAISFIVAGGVLTVFHRDQYERFLRR